MYLKGLFTEIIRNKYSTLKIVVMIHSAILSWLWYFLSIQSTLSKATNTTLDKIKMSAQERHDQIKLLEEIGEDSIHKNFLS